MTTFRTFGIEEHEVLGQIREYRPIIRPEVSYSLEGSVEKLVKYLLRGRGRRGIVKENTELAGGEIVVHAEIDSSGVLSIETTYPEIVMDYMRSDFPILSWEVLPL